jgi:hypothetical protein
VEERILVGRGTAEALAREDHVVATLTVVAAAVLVGDLGIAGYIGARRLVVRRLDVGVEDLPPGLAGMRIAQVSDLHVGPHTSRRHLARVASAVRDARPDLIERPGRWRP